MNSNYKNGVIKLRKDGYSIKDIARILGCSKSTACLYSVGVYVNDRSKIEENIRRNSKHSSDRARKKWDDAISIVIEEARMEWDTVKKDPEIMGFLGLYWGEGTKNSRCKTPPVGIANSDPDIILKCKKIFDKFGNNVYYCHIIIYEDLNRDEMIKFWENKIGVEIRRVEVRKSHGLRRCKYGTCYLKFSNYKLIHRILTWIDCWKAEVP